MRYRKEDFRRRRRALAVVLSICLVLATGCGGTGAQNAGDGGAGQQAPEEPEGERRLETISFGEESEWETWTDYLYEAAKDETYAFAFIEVGSGQATFEWEYHDDREALANAFLQEKSLRKEISPEKADAETEGAESREETLLWTFLKMRIDSGVCGMEIYDYFEQNFAEEGYVVEAWTMDEGNAYAINLEWKKALEEDSTIRAKRKIIVQNGYLYLLSCEDVNDDDREESGHQMYAYERHFEHTEYVGGWLMDEDTLYWSDHTARTTTFQDPERSFVEERASDASWPDTLMGYFGLISEAEYRIRLAPDMPEMTVAFRLKDKPSREGEDIYLFNGFVMDEPYQMEIKTVEGEELIQRTDVNLSIERKDIIYFEDLDEDGYLDMRILYPTHESGGEELYVEREEYWVWDLDKEKMIRVNDSELQARRSGSGEGPEEEIPQTNLSVIPMTVEKGDCLWKISEEYYGDGKYWVKIYEYNYPLIGENPSLIYEGTELCLPWMRGWD